MLNDENIDYLELRFSLLNFMEYFSGGHQELLNLVSMKRKDLATFLHLLNVSLLSMYFSARLGYSKEDVLEIGVAGLFHDIGKLSVARKLIKKKEKLEEEEFAKMKHHSILGAQILFKYADQVGILPVVAAFEHHIRYDGKGYPKLAFPHSPHPVSQIISVCDVYDALSLKRTYKKDFPPLKIYNIMIKEEGSYFDPELLESYFK
jgi:putative nucleotidyltransferase with HDIG domain